MKRGHNVCGYITRHNVGQQPNIVISLAGRAVGKRNTTAAKQRSTADDKHAEARARQPGRDAQRCGPACIGSRGLKRMGNNSFAVMREHAARNALVDLWICVDDRGGRFRRLPGDPLSSVLQ